MEAKFSYKNVYTAHPLFTQLLFSNLLNFMASNQCLVSITLMNSRLEFKVRSHKIVSYNNFLKTTRGKITVWKID